MTKPEKSVAACEELFLLVVEGHISSRKHETDFATPLEIDDPGNKENN